MIDINAPIYPMVNQLFEEDCLECMKRIPNESIDMILCDLPYGMTQNKWDSYIPLDKLWEQYKRIIKPSGAIVLTAQGLFTAKLIMSQPQLYKYKWIWEKSKPTNFLNAKKQPFERLPFFIVVNHFLLFVFLYMLLLLLVYNNPCFVLF